MPSETEAWRRVKRDIDQYMRNPVDVERVAALRATPKSEVSPVAKRKTTRKKNPRRAKKAASRKKNPRRRKKTTSRKTNPRKKRRKKTSRKKSRRKTTTRRRRRNPTTAAAAPRSSSRSTASRTSRTRSTSRSNTTRTTPSNTNVSVNVKAPPAGGSGGRRANPTKRRKSTTRRKKNSTKRRRKSTARRRNPTTKRKSSTRRRSTTRRTHNPAPLAPSNQGALGGLIGNPAGPFSKASLTGYAIAAGGVGAGLVITDLVDRFVATRTPEDGNHPWYGSAAAAAQARRPDAMRLGAQAGVAVISMALTYWTRNGKILPWLFGGTAVGAGANLLKSLTDWWVMPALFSVDEQNEESIGNRLFPLEQGNVQDEVDKIFESLGTAALQGGQQETPSIQGVLQGDGVYQLGETDSGKAGSVNGQAQHQGKVGQPASKPDFIRTGRLGECDSCGGHGGCWSTCDYMGEECLPCRGASEDGGMVYEGKKCKYLVKRGDSLTKMVADTGTDINVVNDLNGGLPEEYWKAGNQVYLPFHMCMQLAPPQDRPPRRQPRDPRVPPPVSDPGRPSAPPPTEDTPSTRERRPRVPPPVSDPGRPSAPPPAEDTPSTRERRPRIPPSGGTPGRPAAPPSKCPPGYVFDEQLYLTSEGAEGCVPAANGSAADSDTDMMMPLAVNIGGIPEKEAIEATNHTPQPQTAQERLFSLFADE